MPSGSDFTASDVVASWKRSASADLGADYGFLYDAIEGNDGKGGMMEKVHQTILSNLDFDGKGQLLEVGCGSGAMVTGWAQIGGTWYYMNSSGVMLTGEQWIDGQRYVFASSGAWVG